MKGFDPGYRAQLEESYGARLARQIADDRKYAYLAQRHGGHAVPYAVARGDSGRRQRPVLFVPGFCEGIVNKASLAAEFAVHGRDFVLPGQNRKGILQDAKGQKSTLDSQARSYLAVAEHYGNTSGHPRSRQLDVVTHSFGSLIFDKMVELAPGMFKGSNVAMLAPAGSIEGENRHRLGRRWISMLKSEWGNNRPIEFPDDKGVTGRASATTLLANIPRTLGEVNDLAEARVNYGRLSRRVGSLSVLTYAQDEMYPQDLLEPTLGEAVSNGDIRWASVTTHKLPALDGGLEWPVSGMEFGGDGLVHDAEQYLPSTVVTSVLGMLAVNDPQRYAPIPRIAP